MHNRRTPKCDYCGNDAVLVTGATTYPGNLKVQNRHYWYCEADAAWSACHENSADLKPVGRLANAELRKAKRMTHGAFDLLWMVGYQRQMRTLGDRANKYDCMSTAYRWLAEHMGLPASECYIGNFTVEQCLQAQQICKVSGHELMERYQNAVS